MSVYEPDELGVKMPAPVTSGLPLHAPPVGVPVNVIAGAFKQIP